MKTYLTIYSGALLLAMLLVPIVSRLARWGQLLDHPGPRKVHTRPVPRIGGIAFVLSTLALVVPIFFLENPIGRAFRGSQIQLLALLAGATFVFLVGLADDIRSLPGSAKLLCILGAALGVCGSGATVSEISLGGLFLIETGWAAWPITVLWICAITACIGVIDGLDGLAAGVAAMVCGILAILAFWTGQTAMTALMVALLGSVTGFLFFNFYPAKIFMGDCGSMFLGFMIGAGSVICNTKTSTMVGLTIPFLALSAPILDTAFLVVCRGVVERRSVFSSDRGHLHHRLLDLGLNHRAAVLVIYALTALFASIGLLMLTGEGKWSTGLLIFLLVVLFAFFACLHGQRRARLLDALRGNWALMRKARAAKICFKNAQERMSQAKTLDMWWQTVGDMARQMNFTEVELWKRENDTYRAIRSLDPISVPTIKANKTSVSLQFGGYGATEWEMRLLVEADDILELCGRKTMLFARLLDRFKPPTPDQETSGAARYSGLMSTHCAN